jgi:hypothetical protein
MKARYSTAASLRLLILSVRAIKLVLAMVAGVMGVGVYCLGFGGAAAPAADRPLAAERQEEILGDEAIHLYGILREIEREDSSLLGVDKMKALKGALNFFMPFPGGNGRSCATCHNLRVGTVPPYQCCVARFSS